jgi:hypothetical protein
MSAIVKQASRSSGQSLFMAFENATPFRIVAMRVVLLLGTASLAGCDYDQWPNPHSSDTSAASMTPFEIAVAEEAYRYLAVHNEVVQRRGEVSFFCLSAWSAKTKTRNGVPHKIVQDLSTIDVPIINYPDCTELPDGRVRAHAAPGPGLMFTVAQINCRSQSECEVKGGFHAGPEISEGHTLTLVHDGRGWAVKSNRLDSIA